MGANEKISKQENVRPHPEYESNTYMTAAKIYLYYLDKVKSEALRIIAGETHQHKHGRNH